MIEESEYLNKQRDGAINTYKTVDGMMLESLSGPGSTLLSTKEMRGWLELLVKEKGITHITDLPCGDMNWMSCVDIGDCQYQGFDIVPEIIDSNREKYGDTGKEFSVHDVVKDGLPETTSQDLLIMRDFLFHISNDSITRILEQVKNSGFRYFLTTSFEGTGNEDLSDNQKSDGWGWRAIDIESFGTFTNEDRESFITETGDACQGRLQILFNLRADGELKSFPIEWEGNKPQDEPVEVFSFITGETFTTKGGDK